MAGPDPGRELVRTAWASASSFRGTDKRGGANGARGQLAPEKDWAVNNPDELAKVLTRLEAMQKKFNKRGDGVKISLADLVVLGGSAGVEQAAKAAGIEMEVPFTPGRTDATQQQTDVSSFAVLEQKTDGIRNFYTKGNYLPPLEALVDRANMLTLRGATCRGAASSTRDRRNRISPDLDDRQEPVWCARRSPAHAVVREPRKASGEVSQDVRARLPASFTPCSASPRSSLWKVTQSSARPSRASWSSTSSPSSASEMRSSGRLRQAPS